MAITWEMDIKPVNIAKKLVSITGVRTDSEDPDNPVTVRISRGKFGTPQDQLATLDRLFARYLSKVTRNTQIATWLAGKEVAAKANLEART